jgi:REP element-mobilizing transposase RayT
MIGYVLTWTTYGSWLQGDERGWIKDGRLRAPDRKLYKNNLLSLKQKPVRLSSSQKKVVENSILSGAKRKNQKVYALAVCSDHVHLVLDKGSETVESSAKRYKQITAYALKQNGSNGRIWTKGYDKRFFYQEDEVQRKIQYVNNHND